MQLEDARRSPLASQAGVRPEQVERLIEHFCRVRETARSYQTMSLWRRMPLLMGDDPLINRLRLHTWVKLQLIAISSAPERRKSVRPSGVHPLFDTEVDQPVSGR
jgi:hypothetical protein